MDKIHRIISLEQAKNRTPNPIEHYVIDYEDNKCVRTDTDTWGGYCLDILIPKTGNDCAALISWAFELNSIYHFEEVEVKAFDIINHDVTVPGCGECNPEDITIAYWVRYKNLMAMYHWLMNIFIPSIDFYQKCESGYKAIKVSDRYKLFETTIQIFENLPENGSFSVGTIIGVTELYSDFITRFISFEICQQFLVFMNKLLTEGLFFPLSGTTPYIDVEFAMTSKSIDFGLMSPLCDTWVEKKKYYLGEVVLYNGNAYILKECNVGTYDKCEITGELLKGVLESIGDYNVITDVSQIPTSTYRINLPSKTFISKHYNKFAYNQCILKEVDETGIMRYYFIQPYYCGEYNNTSKIASFDTQPMRHWELFAVEPNKNVNTSQEYTGITESKLLSLKRKVSSVNDFGEILPFIIKDDNPQNSNGELQYMIGVTNEKLYDDGTFRGDALIDVEINPLNQETGWTSIASSSITSDYFNDNGFIRFTYIIGCELDSSKNIIPYTGVRYVEIWRYNKQHMSARIQRRRYTFDYILITPIDDNQYTNNLDIINKIPILSTITYYGKELKNIKNLLCPYTKKEELLGIQDINSLEYDMHTGRYTSAIDGYIARGTAGALERHQILGEIKTFSDLENYRNNFFQI